MIGKLQKQMVSKSANPLRGAPFNIHYFSPKALTIIINTLHTIGNVSYLETMFLFVVLPYREIHSQ